MKTFIVTTRSESGDSYAYLVKAEEKPSEKQLRKFLLEHGSDVDVDTVYENVNLVVEVGEAVQLSK